MPDFTAKGFGLNRNHRGAPNNARASRRLAGILNTDQLAIVVTNRRARIGLKPTSISRFGSAPPPAVMPPLRNDRVGPRRVDSEGAHLAALRTRKRKPARGAAR